MVISNTVLIRRHCVYLLYFGMIYSASNYYATLKKGEPLYWFLTWEDWRSFAIVAVLDVVFAGVFYLIAVVDEKITGRTKSGKNIKSL